MGLQVFSKIIVFLGNSGFLNVRLLKCYILHWIHFIDAISRAVHNVINYFIKDFTTLNGMQIRANVLAF